MRILLAMAAAFLALIASTSATDLTVTDLRCEYGVNPLGIDTPAPRLFWKLQSATRGQRQKAYQVLAASSAERLANNEADLWNSGKVKSDASIQIVFAGKPLVSSQQVFWKVRVWDKDGEVSPWSLPASWTMGLLHPADWQAQWIGATKAQTLLFRREFVVKPGLRRALIHLCGLGSYELTLNGRKVGDALFPPGWTKYDKTCLYDTYELTSLLRTGPNALGLLLANDMYNVVGGRYTKFTGSFGPLQALGQLRLEYTDGSTELIGTDSTWRQTAGPITFACVYGGEDYDARLEPAGWNQPGFAAANWEPALLLKGPGGQLKGFSCAAPPIRAYDVLKPLKVTPFPSPASSLALSDGARAGVRDSRPSSPALNSQLSTLNSPRITIYDLGQNASLMPRLTVHGPAGSVVRILPAELLAKDGSVDRGSCGGGAAYWQYTLAGHGQETWIPKFYYHGCRYLQVECSPPVLTNASSLSPSDGERAGVRGSLADSQLSTLNPQLPTVDSLEGVVVHSASEPVGQFTCSNPLFNRIRQLVRWAQRSNMMSLMTDCPHREKLGWLEQDHLNGPALRYEFDLAQLFTKAMNDMADSQLENGLVPDIAPEYVQFQGGFRDSPEWGSAHVLVPWQQYEFTGDRELLRRHYAGMKRYVAYLTSRATNSPSFTDAPRSPAPTLPTFIVSHGLGDWYDIGPKPPGVAQLTPLPLTATAFYYYDAWIVAQTAALLGYPEEARHYEQLARQIRQAFNQRFFNPATGSYATGSQCANALPLVMGLVEPAERSRVLEALVKDVRDRGNALTAGDVGYRYLLRALAEGDRSDVIFEINNQSDRPGYGYQLRQGATSLTEAWDAGRHSSQNHFMLGQIQEWFYHDLAGIRCDPDGPGFKKIIIKPALVGDLTWVSASYNSIHGPILSQWQRAAGAVTLKVSIPANTTATIWVPSASANLVTEGGRSAKRSSHVQFLRQEKGYALYQVGSGQYEFHSR